MTNPPTLSHTVILNRKVIISIFRCVLYFDNWVGITKDDIEFYIRIYNVHTCICTYTLHDTNFLRYMYSCLYINLYMYFVNLIFVNFYVKNQDDNA